MHLQLPHTLILPTEAEVANAQAILPTEAEVANAQAILPEAKGVELDRLVFNRLGRKVKFYFRQNRCKRCYSDLTDEQVKTLTGSLKKIGKTGNLVFDNDVYHVSPKTRRLVK